MYAAFTKISYFFFFFLNISGGLKISKINLFSRILCRNFVVINAILM